MVFEAVHEFFERHGDPRMKPYLFMDSIWKPVMITTAYLLICQVIGPWLMKNRKPFNVKKYIMAYNVIQVALNLYLSVMIFFLLRKSYRQMSFLHIYHHAAMIVFTWLAVKYYPGGQSGWAAIFNTIVHVFMYSYYFASAYNTKYRHLPMKKVMTQMQLLQFFLLLYFYGFALLSSCKYSKLLSLLGLSQAVVFIYLFSNFYYHTYIKSEKGKK